MFKNNSTRIILKGSSYYYVSTSVISMHIYHKKNNSHVTSILERNNLFHLHIKIVVININGNVVPNSYT